jgi:hypothetical protein
MCIQDALLSIMRQCLVAVYEAKVFVCKRVPEESFESAFNASVFFVLNGYNQKRVHMVSSLSAFVVECMQSFKHGSHAFHEVMLFMLLWTLKLQRRLGQDVL